MFGDTGWRCKNCGNFNVRTDICPNCGKPKSLSEQARDIQPGSSPLTYLFNESQIVDVGRARSILLVAAIEGVRKNLNNPFQALGSPSNISSLIGGELAFLFNATKEQIDELIWPDQFTYEEKQVISFVDSEKRLVTNDGARIYLYYLALIRNFGETVQSAALLQGALEAKTYFFYQDQMSQFVNNKQFKEYDAFTAQILEEARTTGAALYLVQPLVKSAGAKILLRDWRACRILLDEFYRVVDTASRERPAYTVRSNSDLLMWIKVCRDEADYLRSKL